MTGNASRSTSSGKGKKGKRKQPPPPGPAIALPRNKGDLIVVGQEADTYDVTVTVGPDRNFVPHPMGLRIFANDEEVDYLQTREPREHTIRGIEHKNSSKPITIEVKLTGSSPKSASLVIVSARIKKAGNSPSRRSAGSSKKRFEVHAGEINEITGSVLVNFATKDDHGDPTSARVLIQASQCFEVNGTICRSGQDSLTTSRADGRNHVRIKALEGSENFVFVDTESGEQITRYIPKLN